MVAIKNAAQEKNYTTEIDTHKKKNETTEHTNFAPDKIVHLNIAPNEWIIISNRENNRGEQKQKQNKKPHNKTNGK